MARVPKMTRGFHCCPILRYLFCPTKVSILWSIYMPYMYGIYVYIYIYTHTYMAAYSMYMKYRCYQITTPVQHFYANREQCEVLTGYLWRLKKSNKMQQYGDIYLILNYATCFGRPSHPSSGVHKTVVAAFGTDHTVRGASFFKRDQIRTDL